MQLQNRCVKRGSNKKMSVPFKDDIVLRLESLQNIYGGFCPSSKSTYLVYNVRNFREFVIGYFFSVRPDTKKKYNPKALINFRL